MGGLATLRCSLARFLFDDLEAVRLKLQHHHLGQVGAFFWLDPVLAPGRIILLRIFDESRMNCGVNNVSRIGHRFPLLSSCFDGSSGAMGSAAQDAPLRIAALTVKPTRQD